MIDTSDYHMFVMRLAKPGKDILQNLSANDTHLMHMLLGLSGEVGELIDGLKKSIIYGKPPDEENVIEELGDIEFYLQGIRSSLLLSREECISANMAKLKRRFAKGTYTNEQAAARADKQS